MRINYYSVGSAAGLRLLDRGEADFGAVDSRGSPVERLPGQPCARIAVPMVRGAVVVAYNLPSLGGSTLVLDASVLAGVYAGRITRWNATSIAALNPSLALPAIPIAVIERAAGSGTGRAFTEYLATSGRYSDSIPGDGSRRPTGRAVEGNEGVAAEVKVTVGAIGFMELAYARQNHLAVSALVDSAGSVVTPDASASNYPIQSLTWLVFEPGRTDAARSAAIIDFARWALRDGAAQAAAFEYRALSPDTVARYDSLLAAIDPRRCGQTRH